MERNSCALEEAAMKAIVCADLPPLLKDAVVVLQLSRSQVKRARQRQRRLAEAQAQVVHPRRPQATADLLIDCFPSSICGIESMEPVEKEKKRATQKVSDGNEKQRTFLSRTHQVP